MDDNNNNDDDRPSRQSPHRACLPPSSDEDFPHGGHPSELDLLLSQARIGSHEYYAPAVAVRPFHSPVSSPVVVATKTRGLRNPTTSQNHDNNDHDHDCPEEDARTISSLLSPPLLYYYTPAEKPNNNDDDDDDDTTTEREDIIKIASDDEIEEENSSGDDEGSGVLVEKPSLGDEIDPPPPHPNTSTISAGTSTAITATETPIPTTELGESSSHKNDHNTTLAFPTPKLRFFTDHQSVPTQLQQLQVTAARKRHEFQTHLHQLHCQTAQLTADVAQEQMECHVALRDAVATGVYQPLQQAFERLSSLREDGRNNNPTTTTTTQWMTLEQRVDQLDAQMIHARHVQLPHVVQQLQQQQQERIQIPNDDGTSNEEEETGPDHVVVVTPNVLALEWHDEDVHNTKSETSVARQWESLAGLWARRYQEERAARIATTESLVHAHAQGNRGGTTTGQDLLWQQIVALQAAVQEESALRRAEDARVMQYLQQQCAALQSAILEAYPDK